jgi:Cu/Ag efflux protein CusF
MNQLWKNMRRVVPALIIAAMFGAVSPPAQAIAPCCNITNIDARTATVTAKETATGRTFTFKAARSTLLNSLKVGQSVYANFATKQVSVDGAEPCCPITSVLPAASTAGKPFGPVDGAKPFGPVDGATAKPIAPCCNITGIDVRVGLVTARVAATGKTFSFKVTNASLLNSLKVGQAVYANFGTRQVSVSGAAPCCNIVGGPS